MGRKYDIVNKINAGTQRPTVLIDADHEFKINTSRAAVLSIMAVVEDQKDAGESNYTESTEATEKILSIALGTEACEYIDSLDLDFNTYMGLSTVVMAAIQDMSLDEMEEEVDRKAKDFREKKANIAEVV